MAEKQPQPPPGFQRPGIPGAGNILDPAVRGALREQVQEAVRGAAPQPGGAGAEAASSDESDEPAAPPAGEAVSAPTYRAGPFPHGDIDLRGFAANVPPGPVRPQRSQGRRRFYFLPDDQPGEAAPAESATIQRPDVRKPG